MTDLVAQLVALIKEAPHYFAPQHDFDGKKAAWFDAQRAALSAAKDGGWLPIETAPKDGTEVFVGSTVSPFAFAVASWDGEEWRDIGDIGWAGMTGENNQPTHWQPLPNPPKEQNT